MPTSIMSLTDEDRRFSQTAPLTGRPRRESSMQKIAGPERRTYSSLFIFSDTNPFRSLCRMISESKPFDYFILATIAVNCVLLAINTPLPKEDKSKLNLQLEKAEIYLLVIFIVEAFFKIITLGFVLHPGSYLRNSWNILDFVVVVTGLLSLRELEVGWDASSLKAVRAGRVLRPLKLISGMPSLQVVMKSIMRAMAPLLQICLLVGFVVVIYSIIGLEFLSGKFHYSCFLINSSHPVLLDSNMLCGSSGLSCPKGYECRPYIEGPNYGITGFDNMLLSMLTVFTCITCEGWTDVMYWTFDVYDKHGIFFWIYYYSLNIIGTRFMLNLVLGVLSGEFGKERERVENRTAFLLLRHGQQTDRAFEGYIAWLDKAEQVLVREEEEDINQIRQQYKQQRSGSSRKFEDGGNLGMTKILTKGGTDYRLNIAGKSSSWKQRLLLQNRIFRRKVRVMVEHPAFYWLVIVCVFLNTASVAVQHYRQPQWLTDLQDISELAFLSFFLTEMSLKCYGLGYSAYFRSKFNKFDSVVVTAGVVELITQKIYRISMGISVLRALRLLRLFKFTKYWGALKNLITSLLASMKSIISLLFLLFLFIVIFALLGMQLFGGGFSEQPEAPRTNYDDFWNAMLAVFQIITGEDWNSVMYNGIISNGGPKNPKGLATCLYFVVLVVLGNYTLLNVFLAIAVDNLTNAQEIQQDEAKEDREREEHMKAIKAKYAPISSNEMSRLDSRKKTTNGLGHNNDEYDRYPIEGGKARPGQDLLRNLKNPGRMTGNIPGDTGCEMLPVNTLFLFFPDSRFRLYVHHVVSSKYFNMTILTLILLSSAFLALEDTTNHNATVNKVIEYFDFFFTSVFALELILKVLNYGAILHKGAYFRDVWNLIDALVVSCSIASLVMSHGASSSSQSHQVIKVLRVLRVLRPLKTINKAKKLKAVFQCMVYSLKNVTNILVITFLFLFIFSVMGVQLFSGKFFYCTDRSKQFEHTCRGSYIDFKDHDFNQPMDAVREWKVQDFNFDDVPNAILTLFTSSTGEGWPSVMHAAIDSTEVNKGPLLNNNIQVALYFVFYVVIFSFFFLNIFVALIILTFQEQGEAEEGDCELDRNQRGCLRIAMEAKPAERFMPEDPNSMQYKVWLFIDSVPFEYFIMLLITGNTIILMLKFDGEPKAYRSYLDLVNTIFTFMFTGEFILKLYALRQNYFRDGWNVFDFIIVLGSLLDYIFSITMDPDTIPFDPSLFRLFRAARLIKLLRRGYTIRILLWTFLQSFKALPYVGMLIFLLFFVYAVIGMQMFQMIDINQTEEPWQQINRQNNFRSFFASIQVLFRSATGENWHNIMLACGSKALCDHSLPAVDPSDTYCGSDVAAYIFFISFIFFCSFLMLNLFVAVIMDNFGYLTQDESILGPHHLDEFVRVWAEFDPRATGRIKHTEVCQLLRQMSPPIGLGTKCPKVVAYKRLIRMNMLLHPDNTVDFTATLFALVRTALNIMTDKNNLHSNDLELRLMLKRVWPNITKKTLDRVIPKRPQGAAQMTVGKVYCAKLIYENFKHLKKQNKPAKMAKFGNGSLAREEPGESSPKNRSTFHLNSLAIAGNQIALNYSTPNLAAPLQVLQSYLSHSVRNIQNALSNAISTRSLVESSLYADPVASHKQQIAMAIRSGQSPYELYGMSDVVEDDDWC